jgi:hypothetical protein
MKRRWVARMSQAPRPPAGQASMSRAELIGVHRDGQFARGQPVHQRTKCQRTPGLSGQSGRVERANWLNLRRAAIAHFWQVPCP